MRTFASTEKPPTCSHWAITCASCADSSPRRRAAHRYGVVQERDWNALGDEEFRALVRADFEDQESFGIARFQDHGVLMMGPVLQRFGTEEQRRRYLPDILSCRNIRSPGVGRQARLPAARARPFDRSRQQRRVRVHYRGNIIRCHSANRN